MKGNLRNILVVLVVMQVLVGCSLLQQMGITAKPYSEMSAKEKVTFLMTMYNKQYDDYKVQVVKPGLTDAEKSVLVTKKAVLGKLYPIIQALDLGLVEGKPFDLKNEALAISLLRELGSKI